jgi:hypothetical protein
VAEQNGIRQSALPKQMQLVFARCEIYRPEILRRDFTVSSHGKCGIDKRAVPAHEKKTPNALATASKLCLTCNI